MPSESTKTDGWNRFADTSRALLVGSAIAAPLWRKGFRTSFDGVTALLLAYAACKGVKAFWRERRPNGENDQSFPSEHAADCFAGAVILHREWENGIGSGAIGLATLVCMSRVFAGKHHVADVIAGASLGVLAAEATRAIGPLRSARSR